MDDDVPSARLRRVLDALPAGEAPSVGLLLDRLGSEGPGTVLLLLAAAALVPGAAPVFAFAMLVVAGSLLLGRDALAVPARLRARPVRRARLERAVRRLAPIERRFGAGRRDGGIGPAAVRWTTVLIGFDAILVILPIPLGNAPPALAAMLLAFGLATTDRRLIAFGVAATAGALAFEAVLAAAGVELVRFLVGAL